MILRPSSLNRNGETIQRLRHARGLERNEQRRDRDDERDGGPVAVPHRGAFRAVAGETGAIQGLKDPSERPERADGPHYKKYAFEISLCSTRMPAWLSRQRAGACQRTRAATTAAQADKKCGCRASRMLRDEEPETGDHEAEDPAVPGCLRDAGSFRRSRPLWRPRRNAPRAHVAKPASAATQATESQMMKPMPLPCGAAKILFARAKRTAAPVTLRIASDDPEFALPAAARREDGVGPREVGEECQERGALLVDGSLQRGALAPASPATSKPAAAPRCPASNRCARGPGSGDSAFLQERLDGSSWDR